MIRYSIVFSLLMISGFVYSQNTVGLLSYQPWKSYDGYNLIYPHNQPNVYLLNNCGEVVHMWEDDADFRPANTAYITEEGNLLKTKRSSNISADNIWAGGGGAIVEMRDWDNNLLWQFELNSETERLHHDVAIVPRSSSSTDAFDNVLMIVWELVTEEEAIAAGRDTSLLINNELWPDKIIEYNPNLDSIVWEWKSWDHIIQDFDPTKDNYVEVANDPRKIDINWDTNDGKADWHHANAIDFNPMTNHIVMSVPTFHEFWIIDHSTTTEQASQSIGGLAGYGGDLLYRWGNPAAYKMGTEEDQKLFYQHDVHFIGEFLDPWHPDRGKIGLFNNRIGEDYSASAVMTPAYDMYKNLYLIENGVFAPNDVDRTITHPNPQSIWSTGLSSFQILNNDNYLMTAGRFGYAAELTPDNQVVWEYKTPLAVGAPVNQGDSLTINQNLTFRVKRLPLDYAAFVGKELEPMGYIEMNADTAFCAQILPTVELTDYELKLFPNPSFGELIIEWKAIGALQFEIYDVYGRKCKSFEGMGGRKHLDLSDLEAGIYFLSTKGGQNLRFVISN